MKNPYELELQTKGLYLGWVGVGHALQGTHARRRWLQHEQRQEHGSANECILENSPGHHKCFLSFPTWVNPVIEY